jgi:hypothetical protein
MARQKTGCQLLHWLGDSMTREILGLRAIRGFVDRRLTARTVVVVVTILLLVATWIYPPWKYN